MLVGDALPLREKRGEFLDLTEVEDEWGRLDNRGKQHRDLLLVPVTCAEGPHNFGEGTLNHTYALACGARNLRLKRLRPTRRSGCQRLLLFFALQSHSSSEGF